MTAKSKSRGQTVRTYTPRVMKLLWGRAAGRCAMPDCRIELYAEATDYDPVQVIGEIAHVAAAGKHGPRATSGMTTAQRNDYANLILLCQNCHAKVDKQPGFNTVERLQDIKQAHEAWVRASLPERGRSRTGWTPFALSGDYPLDLATADAAVAPDFLAGKPQSLDIPMDCSDWRAAEAGIAAKVAAVLSGGDNFDKRIAVFPIAPVSACLSLGYHFTSRPHLQLFQFRRDDRSWAWPRLAAPAQDLTVSGLDGAPAGADAVAFLFHLSATITDDSLAEAGAPLAARVDLRAARPSTGWLQHPEQLKWVARETRRAFELALQKFPDAREWHLFYAGPAPAAVAVGQQLNPTMYPPTQLYEFRATNHPRYRTSIRLSHAI